ncbi:class I SAM-dependent methyltransferase [Chroococcidiopsidales cyanobacterium LEGE 13417]|nr:class I SAM-dependent methyltransferase [Chroococcidiopsidales cyanobacterium LEGE 13417]
MNASFPIQNISDTAYGVAIYRAIESERPDALFCDRFARTLAGKRGEQIVQLGGGESAGWLLVVRTCIIDRLVLQSIEREGIDTVLNLGAGLDTRPYRLSLPASLSWIEVDLTAVLEYKKRQLAGESPNCSLELVKLDLTDLAASHAFFTEVNATAKKVLVITEGLVVYLTPAQVAILAIALHRQDKFHGWILDVISPMELKLARKKYVRELTAANSIQQFAPEAGTNFFLTCGWEVGEFCSSLEAAHELNREPPFNWILRRFAPLKQDGIILLKRI